MGFPKECSRGPFVPPSVQALWGQSAAAVAAGIPLWAKGICVRFQVSPIRGGDHLPAWGPWLKALAEGPRGKATPVYGAPGCAARSHRCIGDCYCSSLLILVLCTFGKSDSKCEKGLALAIVPLINKRPSGLQKVHPIGVVDHVPTGVLRLTGGGGFGCGTQGLE